MGTCGFFIIFSTAEICCCSARQRFNCGAGLLEGLGFSPAMLSLITAIYVILNPIITGANVAGDGALVIIFTKFHRKLFAREKQRALK